MTTDFHWIKTVGAPTAGDPRDGELHQLFAALPDAFDLEPWDEWPGTSDAHYVRAERSPERHEDGRPIWIYEFRPSERE